jgi:hypothetical protein
LCRDQGSEAAPGLPITPITPTTGFNAHAGEVMGYPRVQVVFWGRDYGTQTGGLTTLGNSLNNFFTSILPSNYFSYLSEYSVNTPTYLSSTWLDHDPAQPLSLTKAQVESTLIGWLDANALPLVPGRSEINLLYVVFLSREVTISDLGTACAYHSWAHYHKGSGKENLFYAIVTGGGSLAGLTGSASHEMAEAFTDRSGNGWYSDTTGSEIGDVCSCCSCVGLNLNGFVLASYWRNSVANCLQQADLTPVITPPLILPTINVTPFPAPLNASTRVTVHATNPANGVAVPGVVHILQPQRNGTTVTVATFRAPGPSQALTLHNVIVPHPPGTPPEILSPSGTFTPDDTTVYKGAAFHLETI